MLKVFVTWHLNHISFLVSKNNMEKYTGNHVKGVHNQNSNNGSLVIQIEKTRNLPIHFLMSYLIKSGPMGLPFVGYIPFINKLDPLVHKAMKKLAEIHGPVTGFFLGPIQPFISVCGYEAVKEALHNEDLNGRPSSGTITDRTFMKDSVNIMIWRYS